MIRPNVLLLLTGTLLLSASGCAVMKATQQPDKKNLSVLSQGTPRTHLIAELGPPIWSEERRGVTTDVFVFKQGYSKGTKAGRAFVHGAADVATSGLWEIVGVPAETLANGTPVKVQVVYDSTQKVSDIEVIEGQDAIEPRPLFSLGRRKTPTIPPIKTPEEAAAEYSGEESLTPKSDAILITPPVVRKQPTIPPSKDAEELPTENSGEELTR